MGGRLKIKDNLQVGSLNKWIRIKIDFIFFLKGGRGGVRGAWGAQELEGDRK